jgi:putative redox protein
MVGDRLVRAKWAGGFQVDVQAGAFGLRVDEPERVGGSDTGPQPTDLLLSAVASCFVLSLAYAAAKRDIAIERIDVDVTGRYEGPRFAAIRIEVDVDAPDDVVAALISAAERVCYVTNTLKRPPEISVVARSAD